jgi:hypothetical protein
VKRSYQGKQGKSKRKFEVVGGRELLLQLPMPLAEVWVDLQAEVEQLAGEAGPRILHGILEEEVRQGMEETLTVHRLRLSPQLRRTLASTNVIESAFSIVETVCRNVKRWRGGDHLERWVGSGLLVAERQFRKIQGYREIPSLLTSLAHAVSKKTVTDEGKVA